MMHAKFSSILIVSSILGVSSAWAAVTGNVFHETIEFNDNTSRELVYHTGSISLENGLAKLTVPAGFKYLAPEDAKFVMEDLYGNDPADTLGLMVPEEYMINNDENPRSYFVDITWNPDGYISDKDAETMDYSKVLDTLKQQAEEINNDPSIKLKGELLGWAEPPYYNKDDKVLYFAKNIHFFGSSGSTLNYNIQSLGRKGYIQLNLVAKSEDLALVKKDFPSLVGSVAFAEGQRYSDYNETTDPVADYGLSGLLGVAGVAVVAKKVGIFLLLAKFWKLLAVAIIAFFKPAVRFAKRIFGREPALSSESVKTEE